MPRLHSATATVTRATVFTFQNTSVARAAVFTPQICLRIFVI